MTAAQKQPAPLPALASPGRFTRVMIETRAGEIEARLSEYGNRELKVRRQEDNTWKLAYGGDLDCGAVTNTQSSRRPRRPLLPVVMASSPVSATPASTEQEAG